jgi:glycosyltransferase involved in cell wall biosynthesis
MPRVSVILNCYRQAPYVREAVESVLGQTFDDFELIAIDNGSPDNTPEILRSYEGNPHVRLLLHRDNRTISSRFNEGVAAARGEFISFLYSDDFYLPHKLKTQVAAIESLPADYGVVYAPLKFMSQASGATWVTRAPVIHGSAIPVLLGSRADAAIDMITPLARRACFQRHRFLDDVFAEGEGIFLRIALTHKFDYLPDPVATCRDTGENRGKALRVNCEMHEQTLRTLEADPAFKAEYRSLLRGYRARLLRNAGFSLARVDGDAIWARHALLEAIRLDPIAAASYRAVIGLGLLALPGRLRARVNAIAHRVRGVRKSTSLVAGYGGSSGG